MEAAKGSGSCSSSFACLWELFTIFVVTLVQFPVKMFMIWQVQVFFNSFE